MNNPLSVIVGWIAALYAGYLSWQIVEPESFLGAIGFLILWAILGAIFRWIVVLIVIQMEEKK